MVTRFFLSMLLVGSLAGLARAQPDPGQGALSAEEKAVVKVEQELEKALAANDIAALDRIYSTDFAYTNETGELIAKRQLLEQLQSGKHKVNSVKHEDVRLHSYGNTVVMTGTSTSTIGYRGNVTSGPRRFTNVFIKQDGRWQLAAHQVTDICQPQRSHIDEPEAEAKQEILKVEDDEKHAILSRDAAMLERIYAEKMAWTGRGELLGKKQVIADFVSGRLRNNTFVHTNININLYGDTAVLTGYSTSELVFEGRILKNPKRFTDILIKMDGRWQIVARSVVEILDR
jgi:ketosteroid isomerase-like protein